MTALLAAMPLGNGPDRSHIRLRKGLANIARRVAMAALANHCEDVLLEVYAAGIAHATELLTKRDAAQPDVGSAYLNRED